MYIKLHTHIYTNIQCIHLYTEEHNFNKINNSRKVTNLTYISMDVLTYINKFKNTYIHVHKHI